MLAAPEDFIASIWRNFIGATGTAAGVTTDNQGYAAGQFTLELDAAGTGYILAGDKVTFGSDPNVYTIDYGCTDVSQPGGVLVLTTPLLLPIPAAATAITVVGTSLPAEGLPLVITADAADLQYPCVTIEVMRVAHKHPSVRKLQIHVTLCITASPAPTEAVPVPRGTSISQAMAWLDNLSLRINALDAFLTFFILSIPVAQRTGYNIPKMPVVSDAVEVKLEGSAHVRSWQQTINMWLVVD